MPATEDAGFITVIDEFVMSTACAQMKSWLDAGLPAICITVNLSAREFQNAELISKIARVLENTGAPPGCLNIEITESLAMSDIDRTITRLSDLAKMGVHAYIDDFGTGYSSLNYLKRLPIHKLKIDKSFIKDLGVNSDDRAIIIAITAMAHNMRMSVLAEGVETREQLSFLRSMINCCLAWPRRRANPNWRCCVSWAPWAAQRRWPRCARRLRIRTYPSRRRRCACCATGLTDALADLAQIAKANVDSKFKLLALRGQIRLIPLQTVADAQKVSQIQQVLPLLERLEEQSLALATLGALASVESLALIKPYLTVEALKEEAGVAAVAVAEKIVSSHPAEVAAAMALVQTNDKQLARRVRKVLEKVPAGATETGFTPMAVMRCLRDN